MSARPNSERRCVLNLLDFSLQKSCKPVTLIQFHTCQYIILIITILIICQSFTVSFFYQIITVSTILSQHRLLTPNIGLTSQTFLLFYDFLDYFANGFYLPFISFSFIHSILMSCGRLN